MPRFVFRAQAALDFRRQHEEQALRSWTAASAALDRARGAEREAEHAVAIALAGTADAHDPARRAWHRNWVIRLQQQLGRCRQRVQECATDADAARARLNLARRDVKALERLRARALSAWQLAERRAEQKELDWLGCVKHALRQSANNV